MPLNEAYGCTYRRVNLYKINEEIRAFCCDVGIERKGRVCTRLVTTNIAAAWRTAMVHQVARVDALTVYVILRIRVAAEIKLCGKWFDGGTRRF